MIFLETKAKNTPFPEKMGTRMRPLMHSNVCVCVCVLGGGSMYSTLYATE